MTGFGEKWLCCGFLLLLLSPEISAQKNDSTIASGRLPNIFTISPGIHHGFIFAHSPLVENTNGAHPTGMEISIGWQRSDPTAWNLCNCFPRKGLLISYYDFDTK
ncbi:MAG TPA: hypothetical protein VFO70_08850, partial [Chitinophagaceae bacterium]|nr:hypothetical protein [Chitinophagaceae bacterium]